jgi:hypothetical protein
MKTTSHSSAAWWAIGSIVIVVAGLIALSRIKVPAETGRTTREVALTCTTEMATKFHIHPNLELRINDSPVEVPANIGIKAGCMNAIHTHDASGQIHVESPEKRDFTLADLFAIWNKPFSKEQILDSKIDEKNHIRMTVNGADSQAYENLVLKDGDKIVIYYEATK